MASKKMLVAGASGLVGHAAIDYFSSLADWEVVGVSRRVPDDLGEATLVSVDLTDVEACEAAAPSRATKAVSARPVSGSAMSENSKGTDRRRKVR